MTSFFGELIDRETFDVRWDDVMKIPEFSVLSETKQTPVWHREGDAMAHTRLVVESMQRRINGDTSLSDDDKLILVAAALCHDIGKGTTTTYDESKGDYVSHNHSVEGERIVRELFFDEDFVIRERVCNLVRHHMTFHHIFEKGKDKQYRDIERLMQSWNPLTMHLMLWESDCEGSINDMNTTEETEAERDAILAMSRKARIESDPMKRFVRYFGPKSESYPKKIEAETGCEEGRTPRMLVMIGLPGSGKNFYIDNLSEDMEAFVLSRDDIRTEMGLSGEKPQGNAEEEKRVTEIFNSRLEDGIRERMNIVINNVNLRKRYREYVVGMARRNGYRVEYVIVDTPLTLCRHRRYGMMPESVITRMLRSADFPEPYECDKMTVIETRMHKFDADGSHVDKQWLDEVVRRLESVGEKVDDEKVNIIEENLLHGTTYPCLTTGYNITEKGKDVFLVYTFDLEDERRDV